MFPVDVIKQIEILRGPGSVLYGTSAYTSVINIITKDGGKNSMKSFVRYGSFQTIQAGVSGTTAMKGLKVSGGVNYLNSKGWDFTARDEKSVIRNQANTADSALKAPVTIPMAEQGIGTHLRLGYKGLSVNAAYVFSDQRIMGRTPVWRNPIDYNVTNNKGLVDIGYSHKISKAISTSVNATYNYFLSTHYIPLPAYKDNLIYRTSNDLLAEFTTYIKPAENLNITIGALANMQSGWATQPELTANFDNFDLTSGTNPDPHYQVPAYNETWGAAYLQADYRPVPFAKIITGIQANKVTGLPISVVPRLGTIFYMTKQWYAKVLYGQAFRSPAFFERYTVSLPGIVGNQNLSPELVGTFETQLGYTSRKYEMAVTYFNSKQSNLITRSNVKDSLYITQYKGVATSIPQYINRGSLTSQGVEAEGKANFTKRLSAVGSFAYQTNTNDNDRKDVYGTPMTMTKLGLNYTHEKGFGMGIFDSYFGKGGDISAYSNGKLVTKQVNPQVRPYHYMTLNVNADVFKLLKVPTDLQGILNIYTNNLLNEAIYYPEVVRRNMNSLPGRPGRGIYASLQLKF